MAEESSRNIALSTEDLQAIIAGVASSEILITGIAEHLRPQLETITTRLAATQDSNTRRQENQPPQHTNREHDAGNSEQTNMDQVATHNSSGTQPGYGQAVQSTAGNNSTETGSTTTQGKIEFYGRDWVTTLLPHYIPGHPPPLDKGEIHLPSSTLISHLPYLNLPVLLPWSSLTLLLSQENIVDCGQGDCSTPPCILIAGALSIPYGRFIYGAALKGQWPISQQTSCYYVP